MKIIVQFRYIEPDEPSPIELLADTECLLDEMNGPRSVERLVPPQELGSEKAAPGRVDRSEPP
jgi:hypothetical protein